MTVQGINGRRMYETWYQMDALLVSGKVDLKPLITHRFKMADFQEAFEIGPFGQRRQDHPGVTFVGNGEMFGHHRQFRPVQYLKAAIYGAKA